MTEELDLAQLESRETFDMKVMHPLTGDPTSWIVTHTSYDTDKVRKLQSRIAASAMKSRRLKTKQTMDEQRENTLRVLAATLVSWNIRENGQVPSIEEAEAIRIFKKFPWLAEQIDASAGEIGNFIPS